MGSVSGDRRIFFGEVNFSDLLVENKSEIQKIRRII